MHLRNETRGAFISGCHDRDNGAFHLSRLLLELHQHERSLPTTTSDLFYVIDGSVKFSTLLAIRLLLIQYLVTFSKFLLIICWILIPCP